VGHTGLETMTPTASTLNAANVTRTFFTPITLS
jgi:hypothetical protein